jgi:hypothetical protein
MAIREHPGCTLGAVVELVNQGWKQRHQGCVAYGVEPTPVSPRAAGGARHDAGRAEVNSSAAMSPKPGTCPTRSAIRAASREDAPLLRLLAGGFARCSRGLGNMLTTVGVCARLRCAVGHLGRHMAGCRSRRPVRSASRFTSPVAAAGRSNAARGRASGRSF